MVNYIELDGKKYPVRVSFYVLKHFKEETGRELADFDDLADIEPFIFYALEMGHKAESKEMPFNRDDFEIVIDRNFESIIKSLPKIIEQLSFLKPVENKDKNETVAKKKTIKPQ